MNLQDPQNSKPGQTKLPQKISRYQIIEELGRGGMGCVYKAFDPQMNKVLALKVLFVEKNQEKLFERFQREARAMAKMNHPNIVKVYAMGNDNEYSFLTMDYIEGTSLKKYLKNTEVNIRLFSQIMLKIGRGVAYAHKQGVIHRDLKPSNILLDKNAKPYVVDFGLARLARVEKSLTKEGAILGTPQYMPPEQARGKKVNHLADVYSLGAIFYEMLAAKPLVEGETSTAILFNVIHKEPVLLKQVNNKLSKDLETICHKAAAKEIEKRYQSAREFTEDIERFLTGKIIKARALSVWEKACAKIYRNKWGVITGGIGVLLAIVAIWIFENRQNLEVYRYLQKAKKWQQKTTSPKVVGKQMEIHMEVNALLEKALEISPKNPIIKKELIKVQKTMGILAKEQKNYLLSSVLLKRCKNLGNKDAQKLLDELEQEKNQQQKYHRQFIEKAMQKIQQNTTQQTGLIDRQ